MTEQITKAAKGFFDEILQIKLQDCKEAFEESFFCSKIFIIEGNFKHEISFFITKDILSKISETLVFDPDPNHEALIDLTNEVSNIIAGNAKTILEQERGYEYTLSTPKFVSITPFPKDIESHIKFKANDECFAVGLRRLKN